MALLAAACGGNGNQTTATRVDERDDWTLATPAEAGTDEAALTRLERRLRRVLPNVRSVVVARDGRLVFERYYGGAGRETRFEVYSVTKSVVSALVGIAIADGKLGGVDQRLTDLFPRYAESTADPRLRRVTLGDLLTMRAGFSAEPIQASSNWMRTLLTRPFDHAPGAVFQYDSGSTHLLSGVLTEVTRKKAADLARAEIFRPLGIEGWRWPDDGQGVTVGSGGLAMRARDLAKLGQLYLQNGEWDGKRIVPAAWVRESTRIHARIGAPRRGYGYQWWISDAGVARGYAALGYGGQAVAVLPALDLVVVITSLPVEDADLWNVLAGAVVPAFASR